MSYVIVLTLIIMLCSGHA